MTTLFAVAAFFLGRIYEYNLHASNASLYLWEVEEDCGKVYAATEYEYIQCVSERMVEYQYAGR